MYTAKGNGILFACEDKDFGEKYTRSSFKFKYGGYYNSDIAKKAWNNYINEILEPLNETYSMEQTIKITHCLNCDKILLLNNSRRYCCNCIYYYITNKDEE